MWCSMDETAAGGRYMGKAWEWLQREAAGRMVEVEVEVEVEGQVGYIAVPSHSQAVGWRWKPACCSR